MKPSNFSVSPEALSCSSLSDIDISTLVFSNRASDICDATARFHIRS